MEADITLHQRNLAWYLGIDFGTTGISAALFNERSGKIHPIYWKLVNFKPELDVPEINLEFTFSTKKVENNFNSTKIIYRLPSIIYIAQKPEIADNNREESIEQKPLLLESFKPHLKIAIPYVAEKNKKKKDD